MDEIIFQRTDNYEALSEMASERMVEIISQKPKATLCLATGGTPRRTYALFVEKIRQRHISLREVTFVKLDEWLGIPLSAKGTCETFLQTHILRPLNVAPEQFISFRSQNITQDECQRVIRLIDDRDGLDLCLLGLGKNGHLGLNEPGEMLDPTCHISELEERTRCHDMIKDSTTVIEKGITLGLKDIMAAREVLCLVAGKGKQEAFARLQGKKLSCAIPASFLWLHHNTHCIYDGEYYQVEA